MIEQLWICEYHIIQLQINKDESGRYTGAERKKQGSPLNSRQKWLTCNFF